MNKKILVVQYYTNNLQYKSYSENINRKYCETNGYDYLVENENHEILKIVSNEGIAIQWYKVYLLKKLFYSNLDYDYFLFLDMDAIFCSNSNRIENVIDENYNVIMGSDIGSHSVVNTGVILIKNSEWSKSFIEKWWDERNETSGKDAMDLLNWSGGSHVPEMKTIFKSALWHEQTVLSTMCKKDPTLLDNIKILDEKLINSRIYYPNSLIFHAYSYGFSPVRDLNHIYTAKSYQLDDSEKIKVVYFIYAAGEFLKLVEKDMERIKMSGLYDDLNEMHVVVSIPNDVNESVFDVLVDFYKNYTKVYLSKCYGNRFEHYGIVKAWEVSHKSNGPILYFHTKGISNVSTNKNEHSYWKKVGDQSFIEMLKYFMIDRYKDCLEKLKTFDQCNVSDSFGRGWPSGNFWWVNSEHLRKNHYPYESNFDRWSSEAWLNIRNTEYSCYQFYNRFYFRDKFTYLPENSYKNPSIMKDKKMNLISAKFMTLMEPENENDLNRPNQTHEVDFTEFVQKNIDENNKKGVSNIIVSFTTMGRTIPDPCYGVKKSLVIEFTVDGDNELYRLVGDEGAILNYKIDEYSSIGYKFINNEIQNIN